MFLFQAEKHLQKAKNTFIIIRLHKCINIRYRTACYDTYDMSELSEY